MSNFHRLIRNIKIRYNVAINTQSLIVHSFRRGSGKSIPNAADDLEGSLVENTTPKLVEDIDKLRRHLKIETWGVVLGGSWGSTLALAYAENFPNDVKVRYEDTMMHTSFVSRKNRTPKLARAT